jgi:hypothetical protein
MPIARMRRVYAAPNAPSRSRIGCLGASFHGKASVTCPAIHAAVGLAVTAIRTSHLRAWRRMTRRARKEMRVVIVSGGYGLVLAGEPIGWYDMRFVCSRWPHRLMESALEAFTRNLGLTAVRAFASGTTDYGKLLRHVRWEKAGITNA